MRRLAWIGVFSLVLLALPPKMVAAQDTGRDANPATDSGFELQQNYPNPFNPTTRIPFALQPSLFADGRPVVVTMRIFNVLQQLVAFPTALNHPMGNGTPVRELTYESPGQKEAFWDGTDLNGRQVASGIYYLQVIVNGKRRVMPMIVAK